MALNYKRVKRDSEKNYIFPESLLHFVYINDLYINRLTYWDCRDIIKVQ